MWRDVLLIGIAAYLAIQWYRREENYSMIHGDRMFETVETKENGLAKVYLGRDRRTGLVGVVRRLMCREAGPIS